MSSPATAAFKCTIFTGSVFDMYQSKILYKSIFYFSIFKLNPYNGSHIIAFMYILTASSIVGN